MNWVKADRGEMRGNIEPVTTFITRNIDWWWINRKFERVRRKKYYDRFLNFGNIQTDNQSVIGEVGPGPFGGIIEVCKLPAFKKVFIDYILEELYNLHYIKWPDDAIMVDAPAERIPLDDDTVDILLSYNTLDHGWDVYECIKECVRISKRCYLAFDCRGDNKNEVDIRRDGHDIDHYQLLHYDDIKKFVNDNNWEIKDMDFKPFPVAFIYAEK